MKWHTIMDILKDNRMAFEYWNGKNNNKILNNRMKWAIVEADAVSFFTFQIPV